MLRSSSHRRQSDPAVYRIQVQGQFPDAFAEHFGGFTLEVVQASQGAIVTRMTGELADQTALISLFRYLDDTGLVLLSVDSVDAAPHVAPSVRSPEGGMEP